MEREIKSKFIITNYSDLTDIEVLEWILEVVKDGRISNNDKQYCYLSCFDYNGKSYQIASDLNKQSDRFRIVNVSTRNSNES